MVHTVNEVPCKPPKKRKVTMNTNVSVLLRGMRLLLMFLLPFTTRGEPPIITTNIPYTWTITTPPGATPPLEYHWTGSDGLSGTSNSVTKIYTSSGTKQATATVADSKGLLISSNFSAIIAEDTGIVLLATLPAPGRITNVVVVGANSASLYLNWSDPTSAVALVEYDIRVSTVAISALNWNSRQRLTNDLPTPGSVGKQQKYEVFPLASTNRYYVAIKVKNSNGVWSAMSNLASGTTTKGSPVVSLAWDPSPDADVVNYRLYWGPSSGVYNGSSDLGNVTNTVFTQLFPGGHYFFVVTAFNDSGAESDPSNELDYLVPGGGMPPSISVIPNQTTTSGVAVGPIAFTVSDAETAVTALMVSATSSNPTLVPIANVVFGGNGANRTITATPTTGQTGTVTITVSVLDADRMATSHSFTLTVNP
jgi:hypothetical protein